MAQRNSPAHGAGDTLLEVRDLSVSFFTPAGELRAVDGVSYRLHRGEVMGIVGESGAGKSAGAYALMGLLQPPGRVVGGSVIFEGEDVLAFDRARMERFRGSQAAMVFQNPMTSLSPFYTVGRQLAEAFLAHNRRASDREARRRALELLELVGLSGPEERMGQYPHQLSGGMRQRVMIAMALICTPKLLIADEPTAALDVTIQAQILELLKELRDRTGMGMLFITHNLGVVTGICDRVSVLYAGKLAEQGTADDIFYRPLHPYTVGLLRSVPRLEDTRGAPLRPIEGAPVDMLHPPSGCRFHPRCPHAAERCRREEPLWREYRPGQWAACHLPRTPPNLFCAL